MSDVQSGSASCLWGGSQELGKGFWQLWEQYRDELYRCCIKWMGGNPTEAEDALSRAMLKAWEKVQQDAGKITNLKGWLTRLTHNLCVDIHRECCRGANRVEDIEGYASCEEQGLVHSEDTPESVMETGEKKIVIRRAIDNLPTRLRETFILHYREDLSYPEIAQLQEISYQNVCKRISQARAILREELRGYFIEEDGTDTKKSVLSAATESAIGEMSQGNGGVDAGTGETVTLSDAVEEVESVGGSEVIEEGSGDVEVEIMELEDLGEESKVLLCSQFPIPAQVFAWEQDEDLFLGNKTKFQNFSLRINSVYGSRILPTVGKLSKLMLRVLTVRSHFIKCWRVWADSGGC